MRLVVALVWLVACSGDPGSRSPRAPEPEPARLAPVPSPPQPGAPMTTKRVVVVASRPSGTFDVTEHPDGRVETRLYVVQNGRGPQIDTTMRFSSDGRLIAYRATGRHELGTKVDETYTRTGDLARWKTEEERGEATVQGRAMFLPIEGASYLIARAVEAAVVTGAPVPLVPAGELRIEPIGHHAVIANGERRVLAGYAITGVELTTLYTWMNTDGSWFGTAMPFWSVVPVGWEAAIEPLIAKQVEWEKKSDRELAARLAHRPPAAGLAYTHARVLDVAKRRWLPDHTVVVVGDTIAAVGPSRTTQVPAGAEVVDLAGKALLPGMIDMHVHLTRSDALLHVASGVTTVRDVGNDPDELDARKARYDALEGVGPHVVRLGFIEGRGPKAAASKVTAETEAEAKAAVESYAKRGYEGIKIYNSMKVELVPVLAKLAHDRGMFVTGHVPVHMRAEEAVRAGYDGIEHVNMLFLNFLATKDTDTRDTTRFTLVGERGGALDLRGKPVRDFLALLRQRQTVIDPTVAVFEDLMIGQPGKLTPGIEHVVRRLPAQTGRGYLLGGLPRPDDATERYRAAWKNMLAMIAAVHAAKIPLVLGTDHIAGLMYQRELELFVQAGLQPGEVLELATLGAARAMKQDAKLGSIAKGKRADLVVVDGDPLADIRQIAAVVSTMRAGIVFPSAPLYEAVGVKPYVAPATTAAPALPECPPDPRFDAPATSRAEPALVGKTLAQLVASRGEPECRRGDMLRFAAPRGCAYERLVTSVWLDRGKVARAHTVKHHTGQHCERID